VIRELLRETWNRGYAYEPFTYFKERPFTGKYVNVDPHGFRVTKEQGPWPPDRNRDFIFLFGGSTSFAYGLPDDQTVASYLQESLWTQPTKRRPRFTTLLGVTIIRARKESSTRGFLQRILSPMSRFLWMVSTNTTVPTTTLSLAIG
jgi:hypothetical protein